MSTLEIPTPDEPLLGPTNAPHFIARQLKPSKHGLSEEDLAKAIQEIEIQTQISGASFIKVHVDDPELKITTSGLIAVSHDGLLNELEVEFPEGSGYFWRLCAADGSTEIASANLTLVFEDITVARLRQQWGHKTAAAGTKTRAQFVKALVNEANLKEHLNPPIRFVSPGINRKEPVETSGKEKKEKFKSEPTRTESGAAKRLAEENKSPGVHAGAEFTVKGATPNTEQRKLVEQVMTIAIEQGATPLATEALLEACIAENDPPFTNHAGGSGGSSGLLQLIPSTAAGLGISALDVKACVTAFLKKGFAGNGGAIEYAQKNPSAPAYEVAQAIQGSGAGALTKGAVNYGPWAGEAAEMIHAFGGITPGGSSLHSNESDVGQLSRGTTQNPDEDSWDCITRLAQQVNWSAFTDGKNTLFYMDGPDLMAQRPKLYIDFKNNHIIREDKQGQAINEYGCLMRPLSWTYDNTSFEYRSTHRAKGKVQHKSRIAKPQTPAEVRMSLLCGLTEYRAGDVFVFRHCGPISENGGRWIVADATRETMRYPYTKFILVPPTQPLPEPKAEQTTSTGGGNGTALQAFEASNTLSQMELPYVWGGGHSAGSLANVKKGGSGLDCSGAVCWVLSRAGMYSKGEAEVSGDLAKFGEAGKGKEMTIWAGPNHVYIEFTISGHQPAQLNTNGTQNGPRLYTLSQGGSYNGVDGAGSGGPFVARHFPGT